MKQRQLEPGKLVHFGAEEKNNCDTLMTDGESACLFFFSFQNFILDILLFATTLANADQNESEAQLTFYLPSFIADACNLCLDDFLV